MQYKITMGKNNPSQTFIFQTTGKKSIVLSSETRKELAKQAKVIREERRAQIDERHKYLISRLADGMGLSEQQVEEAIISDDKVNINYH